MFSGAKQDVDRGAGLGQEGGAPANAGQDI